MLGWIAFCSDASLPSVLTRFWIIGFIHRRHGQYLEFYSSAKLLHSQRELPRHATLFTSGPGVDTYFHFGNSPCNGLVPMAEWESHPAYRLAFLLRCIYSSHSGFLFAIAPRVRSHNFAVFLALMLTFLYAYMMYFLVEGPLARFRQRHSNSYAKPTVPRHT